MYRLWANTWTSRFWVIQLVISTLIHLSLVQVDGHFLHLDKSGRGKSPQNFLSGTSHWFSVSFTNFFWNQSVCQRPSGRASHSIELGEVPTVPQRPPARMADMVTRPLADTLFVYVDAILTCADLEIGHHCRNPQLRQLPHRWPAQALLQACSGRQRLPKIHIRSHFWCRFKVMTAIEKSPLIINTLRKACHYLRTVHPETPQGDDTHFL